MSLSTNFNRKDKTAELIKFHEKKFISNRIANPKFIPKCAYQPRGMEGLHVGFFENEIKHPEDVYTEFVSRDLDPEDPDRSLYKWIHNPHYAEEYATTEPNSNNHVRYLIPVDELVKITAFEEVPDHYFPDFDADEDEDLPLTSITVRDFAAIMLNKPVSKKDWLNTIIKS